MDFSKLKLTHYLTEAEDELEAQTVEKAKDSSRKKKVNSATTGNTTVEHFLELRRQKELIKMMEANSYDWRKQLQEEHPYVDVMPKTNLSPEELLKRIKDNQNAKPNQ